MYNENKLSLGVKGTCKQSFHGRTLATMAATGQNVIHDGFGPLLPSFSYAHFNDFAHVKRFVQEDTAAIMLELVQEEGGIHVAIQLVQ